MIPLQYPAVEFGHIFVCGLYKAIGRKGEPPKDLFSAPDEEIVTYLDIWHALRSMSQYFQSTIKGVTPIYDYRQAPVAMSLEEIVEFFLMIAVEMLDHDKPKEQRRPFTSFDHCEYCYQELVFMIHGFLDCLTHADFGIGYNVSNKLFFLASATAILQGVRLEKEDATDVQDIVQNAIMSLESLHQIPELSAFIHEGVSELGGTIDPQGLTELLDGFVPTPEPETVVRQDEAETPPLGATVASASIVAEPLPKPSTVPESTVVPAAEHPTEQIQESRHPSAESFTVEQQQELPDLPPPPPPVAAPKPSVATAEAPAPSEEIAEPEDENSGVPALEKPRRPD